MITLRQLERWWNAGQWAAAVRELSAGRADVPGDLVHDLASPHAAAAMILIRLDELHQPFVPLASRLRRFLVAQQQADGGWDNAATTALCLRALREGDGGGLVIQRATRYLADLQRADGLWPRMPLRRLPGDALTTAFIVAHLAAALGEGAIHWNDASIALERHEADMDAATRRLARVAAQRAMVHRGAVSWS